MYKYGEYHELPEAKRKNSCCLMNIILLIYLILHFNNRKNKKKITVGNNYKTLPPKNFSRPSNPAVREQPARTHNIQSTLVYIQWRGALRYT